MSTIRSFTDLDAWKEGHKHVGFITKEEFQTLALQSIKVHKITNGLIKSSKNHDS